MSKKLKRREHMFRDALAGLVILASVGLWNVDLRADVITSQVNPANNHIYYLLTQDNWTGSEAQAVALGGHLTTVNDANENSWIYSHFSNYGSVNRRIWIGLTDAQVEGSFHWINGEALAYSNWESGEPSGDGDYVHMYWNDGKWNDLSDVNFVNGVACYGVAEVVPEPASLTLITLGGLALLCWRK
jgi:hypothetical protein